MSTTKLSSFKIEFTGSNRHLYSNGNQQLSLTITAQKTVNGNYVNLTSGEKNSIKVTERSENVNASLPSGWSSDNQENGFSEGAYSRTSAAMAVSEEFDSIEPKDGNPDVATRYLRTTDTASHQFMATIVIEGKTYTTNMADYNNYVEVSPTPPYRVTVDGLNSEREDAFTKETDKYTTIDVDVYYWTLPNLTVKQESFSGAGTWNSKLESSFAQTISNSCRLGKAIKKDVTSLTVGDIINGAPNPSDNIPIRSSSSYLRALRYLATHTVLTTSAYDNNLHWTIVDNYGCTQKYILRRENTDYNKLILTDG